MKLTARRHRVMTLAATLGLAIGFAMTAQAAPPTTGGATPAPSLELRPADRLALAQQSAMLAAVRAGPRIVAVGERGIVLLSDDDGASFRQADEVPVSATLTSLSFVDEKRGWAVGHWGVVIRTDDGGQTWRLQRHDLNVDQPLLAVHFLDGQRGVAVGLWSLVITTRDGGKTWSPTPMTPLPGSKKADLNLYGLFPGAGGEVFACAEQGQVLRSTDAGASWQYLDTGYKGSLWAGLRLADGALLVGGLRGTVMRSQDSGATWHSVATNVRSSVTGLQQAADGSVYASALDGIVLTSRDGGNHFTARQSSDRMPYTGFVLSQKGAPILLSREGPKTQLP
jgi:photosystem II stability/assembly factor-like uncharacterized protein